jgi:prevent-host-death family protein
VCEMYSYNVHMTTIVNSTSLRNNLADALRAVKKGKYLLISQKGVIKKAIIDVEELEDLLSLHDEEYLKSIRQARADAKAGRVYTFEEVFGNIK